MKSTAVHSPLFVAKLESSTLTHNHMYIIGAPICTNIGYSYMTKKWILRVIIQCVFLRELLWFWQISIFYTKPIIGNLCNHHLWLYTCHCYNKFCSYFNKMVQTINISLQQRKLYLTSPFMQSIWAKGANIFHASESHFEILGARMLTWKNFRTENPKILGVIVSNTVTMTACYPGIVHFWSEVSRYHKWRISEIDVKSLHRKIL
jgi:hypothetical protein